MPKLANKHKNAELVVFADFSGGLNLALPPESIAMNEMQECVNFEFAPDTGLLRVRGGLNAVYTFNAPVTDIIKIAESRTMLVRSGDYIYKLYVAEGVTATYIGTVDGDRPASYELWGEDGAVMAFGGKLYVYDGTDVTAVTGDGAPEAAETVYVRSGRVGVTEVEGDEMRFSGVGDPTMWTDVTADDSSAKSVQIGYKDGCNIKAVAGIAGEIVIFKCPDGEPEIGRIYRLQGDYPDWAVVPYSRGSSAWNAQSVANVGSDVLFLTREGLGNLATVTEFGDYKLRWAGAKVNPAMSKELTDGCRLIHIPARGQVWVTDGQSDTVWCYHYEIGGGAWTKLKFPGLVKSVATSHGEVFLSVGNTVYNMNPRFESDGESAPIPATMKPKTIVRNNPVLLKMVTGSFTSNATSDVKLRIARLELTFPARVYGGHIAFSDDEKACLDDEPLVLPTNAVTLRKRCSIRYERLTPEVEVINGIFSLASVRLEIAEV
ncbi:hypothetical protein FACS1894204_06170 [Synergistales bacterium]|nr:hypothetical protein FACS1894204_06170 [Synergistales bacterium]